MIYVVSIWDRKRNKSGWYHEESPNARIFSVQRPFTHMSVGPIIIKEPQAEADRSLREYRLWLFKRLVSNKVVIKEFSEILDVLIQEGEIVLQCSCTVGKPCHANVIKSALEWAERFGVDGWLGQLREIASIK